MLPVIAAVLLVFGLLLVLAPDDVPAPAALDGCPCDDCADAPTGEARR